jgi:predicted nucleic acid-binding Zn ribbon protein
MSFTPIKSIVDGQVKKAGIQENVEASLVLEKLLQILKGRFGDTAEQSTKPLYVKRKVVTISCSSSAAAQELKLQEREILKELNEQFSEIVVDRIRFFA